ncbi:M1 family aminopeptidase [Paenibacillus sp. BSR1-1]|uniref:M1 family aminopeptidase n=1 Tax=Paenibacillus sp. BSR1-1 TaxID=3020845 RepID=UPI0025B09936|nr:M1 family aminopeptidase [Paenibacillus sp. BSR1-1]MDN3018884.1 M1 family aminopeptidase [Paenibacillus sp. BSR1-1]
MKRFLHLGWVLLLLCTILAGCNNEQAKGTPKKEKAPPAAQTPKEKKSSEPTVEKGTPEWDMQQIVKSVNDNDQALFMSYQNKENAVFYKEQQRWIEEAVFKKKQGYELSVQLYNFNKVDETNGTVSFSVRMSHPQQGENTNIVIYQMMKVNDKWILNDVPFEKISSDSGNLTVHFMKGHETEAQQTLKDASDIVTFYSKKFNWKPKPISIKIYPSSDEASATVPWIGLSGWNEIGESLKITSDRSENIFRFLAHELTHKMVGDLTNDNATVYIQEGFATYLQNTVVRDKSGNVTYDPKLAAENAAKAIEVKKSVKSIEELGKIDYTDPDLSMYRDGFLLSHFLIETKGLPAFMEMLHYLTKFEYIDKRSEHKMDICQVRTLEAIENVYGPADKVSADNKNYYLNGQ